MCCRSSDLACTTPETDRSKPSISSQTLRQIFSYECLAHASERISFRTPCVDLLDVLSVLFFNLTSYQRLFTDKLIGMLTSSLNLHCTFSQCTGMEAQHKMMKVKV